MKRFVTWASLLFTLFVAGVARADIITVAPESWANIGTGAGYLPNGVDLIVPGAQNQGLLQFNLSAVNSPIQSAVLKLFQLAMVPGAGQAVNIYANITPWSPETVTWSTRPGTAPAVVSSATLAGTLGYREFDVTALVNTWIAGGAPNFGVTIAVGDPGIPAFLIPAFTDVVASDGSLPGGVAADDAPQLVLTTHSPSDAPEPASLILATTALAGIAWPVRNRRNGDTLRK